jgi:hypothetical protein
MNITKHRNWKWFLKVVKDNNTNLHERLVSGLYTITHEEKNKLQIIFDVNSGFTEILNMLNVV